MKNIPLVVGIAAALLISPHINTRADAQTSQGRYTPPSAVVLSPDLSAPWVLQLRRSPLPAKRKVNLARPWKFPALSNMRRSYGNQLGRTPLAADPVRRRIEPRYVARQAGASPRELARQAPAGDFDPKFEPQMVAFETDQAPGTIVIDTEARFLYLVGNGGTARRYGVGVGKPGFEWAGAHKVSRKAEWPDWRPPAEMIKREAAKGRDLPEYVEGGPQNPLGARALYLGSSLYRIHGTNQPWTIGRAVSSGCIRMRNEDVIDLYERVGVGTRVVVS